MVGEGFRQSCPLGAQKQRTEGDLIRASGKNKEALEASETSGL